MHPCAICLISILFLTKIVKSDVLHKKIAVIGGGGNIGSELTRFLIYKELNVMNYDEDPRIPHHELHIIKKNSRSISTAHLQKYDIIIFLGGCSGHTACKKLSSYNRYKRNVLDSMDIVERMRPNQHFIIASTCAVPEGRQNAKEIDVILESFPDDYTTTMYQQELSLKKNQNRFYHLV